MSATGSVRLMRCAKVFAAVAASLSTAGPLAEAAPVSVPAQDREPCGTTAAVDTILTSGGDVFFAVGPTGIFYTGSGGAVVGRDPATGTEVYAATPDAPFFRLIDVAVSQAGEVLALDGGGRVVRFDALGLQVEEFAVGNVNTGESSLAVDGTGSVWVADPFTNTVRAFTPDGTEVVNVIASPPLERPNDIEVGPSGAVYVLDGVRQLLYQFDLAGVQLSATPTGPVNTGETSLAVDVGGHVFVADPFREAVHVFAPDGKPLTSLRATDFTPALGRSHAIESHPDGSVIIVDNGGAGGQSVRIDPNIRPADIRVEVAVDQSNRLVGEAVNLFVTVTSDGDCPLGPFDLSSTATSGMQWESDARPGEPWHVDELGGSSNSRADFAAVVVTTEAGEQTISVGLTGPGVALDATVTVNVSVSPPTTLPVTLPATGGVASAAGNLSIALLTLGTALLGLASRRRPSA